MIRVIIVIIAAVSSQPSAATAFSSRWWDSIFASIHHNNNKYANAIITKFKMTKSKLSNPWLHALEWRLHIWVREGVRRKKNRKKSGILPNLPRTPPPMFGLFTKKNWPIIFFCKMNHCCAKQFLHLVPSRRKKIIFASVISVSLHLPKIGQHLISARH